MPNFKIRRRKRNNKPQIPSSPPPSPTQSVISAPQEEKIDENEMIDEDIIIENALNELRLYDEQNKPQINHNIAPENEKKHFEPQTKEINQPQNPYLANFEQKRSKVVNYDKILGPRENINDPFGNLTRTPLRRRRRPKMNINSRLRFRSHYGAHGDYIDTHTKSNLLYNHCFG